MAAKTAEKEKEKPAAAADNKAAEAAKISAARQRDLDAAISTITKTYGDGSIMRLGDAHALKQIQVIPTGALAVDLALGVGGLPRGRVVEIFGPESSGKTTLMLHVIANAQKNGGLAAFIDAEHALDPAYAKRLGVNLADLLFKVYAGAFCICGKKSASCSTIPKPLPAAKRSSFTPVSASTSAARTPDRKSTRLNSSHIPLSRMPSS